MDEQTKQEHKQEPKSDLKYTDADVDKIIERKFAKWQKQQDEKVAEAQKLAEMNATQKAEYERDQLQKHLDELERSNAISDMVSESRKQLSQRNIDLPDELVQMLVADDAETTKARVDSFAETFEAAVAAAVQAKLAGNAPKKGNATPLTKAQIMSIPDRALDYQSKRHCSKTHSQ
ncbi:DUF4355 domain-containing protein [Atopobium sp. oral taxon 810]|uniref:DUF4355 domain-containing protein n=1 Tax=Atopobium sp. oral taxon 810 TaxID=712158 RepID=UPI00039614F9|nr:DUF4355 domain-containing protein [Atopobium sp. oral taxon 810]ERI05144.1 hypothetical protein HMPREF9069_01066 [Atopobium sp. oral taxon 810 str. F0209]